MQKTWDEHMMSIGLSRRFAVDGRWYEDREPQRQTIAERNTQINT